MNTKLIDLLSPKPSIYPLSPSPDKSSKYLQAKFHQNQCKDSAMKDRHKDREELLSNS